MFKKKNRLISIRKGLKEYYEFINIKLKKLKHTHTTLSFISGDNPHDIVKRLGHTSLQMLFN